VFSELSSGEANANGIGGMGKYTYIVDNLDKMAFPCHRCLLDSPYLDITPVFHNDTKAKNSHRTGILFDDHALFCGYQQKRISAWRSKCRTLRGAIG
jgi:hypothetical protein